MSDSNFDRVSRRSLLKQAAAASCVAWSARLPGAQEPASPDWHNELVAYLETLRRPDGGYAWEDQTTSHLTSTFATIACYHLLRKEVPDAAASAEYVRTHHPAALKKLEQEHREFDYQQIQALLWLREDVQQFTQRIMDWTAPVPYLRQYERHQYPVFRFQLAAVTCRHLLGITAEQTPVAYLDYLRSRRRGDGSFNNTPATDGGPGNILNTWWGLESLAILGKQDEFRPETIAWVQACQAPDGGFRWHPDPQFGKLPDVAYTWAAIRSLTTLNAQPLDRVGAIRYLFSLRNRDGGFGDRPGWDSNAVATRYALESLSDLRALQETPAKPTAKPTPRATLAANLKIFTIQIEAHGTGSPAEAVDLARSLGIHLWGAKNASPEWLTAAQSLAAREQVAVKFFAANEEYGTWIDVPGFGTYSHMSDIVAPRIADAGPSLKGDEGVSWLEFRHRRVVPLLAGQGRLVWQFGENEELVRTLLDDSLERDGFAAISTFHFGNPDFTNSEPFLNRYRGQLPYVALQDAHGPEPWWFSDMTAGMRTLFLATEPTWKGWLTALRNNWVAAVRRDTTTGESLRMHSGSNEVAQFVMARQLEWRWWDNPQISRPMVSVVAIKPEDQLELGRPKEGIALRVRCASTNSTQGQPKTPLVTLKSLLIDGKQVEPQEFVHTGRPAINPGKHTYVFHIPNISAGEHTAAATVVSIADGREFTREIRFRQ
ncbi:MAG: prenyltransferase/squalene oxidase repeat-containing protein [Planctomycetota bacterium]